MRKTRTQNRCRKHTQQVHWFIKKVMQIQKMIRIPYAKHTKKPTPHMEKNTHKASSQNMHWQHTKMTRKPYAKHAQITHTTKTENTHSTFIDRF